MTTELSNKWLQFGMLNGSLKMPVIQNPDADPDEGDMEIYALTSTSENGELVVTPSSLAGESLNTMVNQFHNGATPFVVEYSGSYTDNAAMMAALKNSFNPALS